MPPPVFNDERTAATETSNVIFNDKESQRSILEDILPSFQMHNYIFNRNMYYNNVEELNDNELPDYVSEINTIRSYIPIDLNRFVDPTNDATLNLLNNIKKLKYVNAPIEVKIVLTKKQPMIGKSFEKESVLTQYKSGDLVTGYVTIKSNIDQPIPFEILTVSLEGELKTPAGGFESIDRQIIDKCFLRMYDLNASYTFGNIPINAHGVTGKLEVDKFDDTIIGFNEKSAILPNVIHKKFFSFKLPYALLDTVCQDQIPEHLHLLPSFGFDKSSLGDNLENLDVDPALGYKRCEAVYGSSIKVNDTALIGQSVSYFIKVQIVGLEKSLKRCNFKIIDSKDSNNTPFVLLSNEHHYLRVDVSKDKCIDFNDNESGDSNTANDNNIDKHEIKTNIRTYEQLTKFENYVVKTINELKTKYQLAQGGIFNKEEQDEIIAALQADDSKKVEQLKSSTNFHEEKIRSNDSDYLNYDTIDIGKDFFGRPGGDLIIKASMSRESFIHSIKSFALKSKNLNSRLSQSNLKSKSILTSSSLKFGSVNKISPHKSNTPDGDSSSSSVPVQSISSNSSNSLETILSLPILKQANQDHCFVDFELKFNPHGKTSKVELPSSILISPSMKNLNIYSTSPIPVSIDGEFLMDEQLLQYTIPNIRRQFEGYLTQLKRLVLKVPIQKTFYNSVHALSKLSVKEVYVPNCEFLSESVDLTKKWIFDPQEQVYKASFKLPLAMDSKNINRNTFCLVPTFESCNIDNFYMIRFQVSVKKSKKYSVFKFPLKVV